MIVPSKPKSIGLKTLDMVAQGIEADFEKATPANQVISDIRTKSHASLLGSPLPLSTCLLRIFESL